MIRFLKIQVLRVRLGLLRLERAMRLDAMLTMYAEKPLQLSAEIVREVLRDVDDDIAATELEIDGMRRPLPSANPGAAWYVVLLLMVAVLLVAAIVGESREPAGPSVQPTVWRQA